jgi:hypothetical protein
MHIAGGLYRELCEVPPWDKHFGSGGRAAAAIIALSPGSTLHTFIEDRNSPSVQPLEALGVRVIPHHTTVSIAFSYFHPLSRPLVIPKAGSFANSGLFTVEALSVLRFGMLEGSAIVTAKRAVYDPQTAVEPEPFQSNGSTAEALAMVLNEDEVRAMVGRDSIEEAAEQLLVDSLADVVIVKCGAKGLLVCEGGSRTHLPAYKSPSVFKIGTGDIFSAVFAVHWAERNSDAALAADLASLAVATYASSVQLPLPTLPEHVYPAIPLGTPGIIFLEGPIATLGERYLLEEARHCLRMLGAEIVCPKLDGIAIEDVTIRAILFCADGYSEDTSQMVQLVEKGTKLVLFSEKVTQPVLTDFRARANVSAATDFTTAIYHSYWASIPSDQDISKAYNG